MKIMLAYRSENKSNRLVKPNFSNRVVSSTMSKFERHPIYGITVERINVDKINIKKYLEKLKEQNKLPDVIYVADIDDIEIPRNTENLLVKEYNNKIMYKPSRVPGNKLKTRVYYLYEKILIDIETEFREVITYVPRIRGYSAEDLDIKELKKSEFEIRYPMCSSSRKGFETKDEAIEELKSYIEKVKRDKERKIKENEKSNRLLQKEIHEHESRLEEILKVL